MKRIKIDCRKCPNCDKANDCCRIYGNNPDRAIEKCAGNGFKAYWPIKTAQAGEVKRDET